MKYREKSVEVVDAIKHEGIETWPEVYKFIQSGNMKEWAMSPDGTLSILTVEGRTMLVQIGDWITLGARGLNWYRADWFEMMYEKLEDTL